MADGGVASAPLRLQGAGSRISADLEGLLRTISAAELKGAISLSVVAFVLIVAVFCGMYWVPQHATAEQTAEPAPGVMAVRIVCAESNGNAHLKNRRSSASGAAQFIDETWLRMVRTYRPDLAKVSRNELLKLRHNTELVLEITAKLVERNSETLRRRQLPVTPGSLYLSHFAGPGGAVALLLADDTEDAGSVMAQADATGQSKRERVVRANPFLARFTVADIKSWADKKMVYNATRCGSMES